MHDDFNPLFSASSSRQEPSFFLFLLAVVLMHLGLLGIGSFWNPSPPKPKEKTKVVVQTIRLDPVKPSTTAKSRISPPAPPAAALSPPPPPKPILQPESPKTAAVPVQDEIAMEKEIPQLKEEAPPKKEEVKPAPKEIEVPRPPPQAIKPPSPEIKKESKPEPKKTAPKPAPQENKKPPAKKTAPVKKPAEPAKKPANNPEPAKPKPDQEAEKKKQQEKAEAEKKKEKEQAEAEKKRAQELAAEKKRQQEIAAAEEAARQKEQALISKARENLAKIGESRDKISSSSPSLRLDETNLPKELGALQVDALPVSEQGGGVDWGAKEVSYSSEVASRLKKALRLPDYGAVKIKLTLDRTGKVVKVETVQSESHKNKAYVESKVPGLLFPPFGQRFKDAEQNTFVITFQNDS